MGLLVLALSEHDVEGFMRITYAALIRTFNSANTLQDTLFYLSRQTASPAQYIFVDSGSTDGTLTMAPYASILHRYDGKPFNFSEAINQGVEYVVADYVLIISSHTILVNPNAIEYALTLLSRLDAIGAAYFCSENTGNLRHTLIHKENFDGFNVLWNTWSLIRVDLLRKRAFRSEVFAAEDQEWARWLLYSTDKMIARIAGAGMSMNNRYTTGKPGQNKLINEYVAIAYFANRSLLTPRNLARIVREIFRKHDPAVGSDLKRHQSENSKTVASLSVIYKLRRRSNLKLICRLLACYFVRPRYQSRYFSEGSARN